MDQYKKKVKESLKNMTIEELKNKLDELGVKYELAKKPKRHYIELAEKAIFSNLYKENSNYNNFKEEHNNHEINKNNLNFANVHYDENCYISNNNKNFNGFSFQSTKRIQPESSSRIKVQSLKLLNNKREKDSNTALNPLDNVIHLNNNNLAELVKNQQELSNLNNVNIKSIIQNQSVTSKSYNNLNQDNNDFRQPSNVDMNNNYITTSNNNYSSNKGLNICNNNTNDNKNNTVKLDKHISSRSLKGLIPIKSMQKSDNLLNNNTKNKLVHDAFNNTKIDLVSETKPFSRSRSRTPSIISGNFKPNSSFQMINKNNNNSLKLANTISQSSLIDMQNLDIDYALLFKVASGSIFIYSLVYYLYKYQNSPVGIESMLANTVAFIDDNKKEIMLIVIIVSIIIFIYAFYSYLKSNKDYDKMCVNIAYCANKDTVEYIKNLNEIKNQSFVEENMLVSYLSEKYCMSESDFYRDVYQNFLKRLLETNEFLCRKDIYENGNVKLYWIYDVDEDIEVFDNKLNDDNLMN